MGMRLRYKSKSNNYTEPFAVYMAGKEGKNVRVPGEVCAERFERSNHRREAVLSAQKSAEVIVARKFL